MLNIILKGEGGDNKMKKIVLILSTLFVASALAMAFNVTPAKATYTSTIVSDTDTEWFDPSDNVWKPAVACYVHPSWPTIDEATWIWRTEQTDPTWEYDNVPYDETTDEYYWTFRRIFDLPDDAYDIRGTLVTITADNAYKIYINDVEIGGDGPLHRDGPDSLQWKSVETYYDFDGMLCPGENIIIIKAVNFFRSGTYSSNPAGLIYKVVLTYETPLRVDIDIKPGSFPNSVCLNDQGLLPVAILGSETFNVQDVNPETICIGEAPLANRGNPKRPKLAYSLEDVNEDGYTDLIAFFSVQELINAEALKPETTELKLDAQLYDGTPIYGIDSVRIVPP